MKIKPPDSLPEKHIKLPGDFLCIFPGKKIVANSHYFFIKNFCTLIHVRHTEKEGRYLCRKIRGKHQV